MTLLQLANSHPQIVEQMGMSVDQLQGMIAKAEKEQQMTKMTQEEKEKQNLALWTDWLIVYRYVTYESSRW